MAMYEIPYLYRVKAVPRRHQNPVRAFAMGTVAVRIEEIPASECPPAARLLNAAGQLFRTYRALRDGLGAPVGGVRPGEKGFRPWNAEELGAALLVRSRASFGIFQKECFSDWWDVSCEPTDLLRGRAHVREWIWDDRAEREAAVLRGPR